MQARGGRAVSFRRACTRTPWNNEEAWTDEWTDGNATYCTNVLIELIREGGRKKRRTYSLITLGHTGTWNVVGSREVEPGKW